MSFFTVAWQPPADIGLLPQHAGDGTAPFFTVAWQTKFSATYLPYDPDELTVKGGTPAPVAGPATPATPAPLPPATVRPRVARAYLSSRKNPSLFRRTGLKFQLDLPADATVSAVLVTSKGRHKLTFTRTARLTQGGNHVTLRASQYGKLVTRHSHRVQARLEISIAYADGAKGSTVRSVILESPPAKAKKAHASG